MGRHSREISLWDLFLFWARYVYILIIVSAVAAAISYIYYSTQSDSTRSNGEVIGEEEVQIDADSLKNSMSDIDALRSEELAVLHGEYTEAQDKYERDKATLSAKEMAETVSNLVNAKNNIDNIRGNMSSNQQRYYSVLIGAPMNTVLSSGTGTVNPAKKALTTVLIVIVLYTVICLIGYIIDDRIKPEDNMEVLYEIPEIMRVADQGKKNLLQKLYLRNTLRLKEEEAIAASAESIVALLHNKGYNAAVIIGDGAEKEREALKGSIAKADMSIALETVDSVINHMKECKQAAILVIKTGVSKYNDIYTELSFLRMRDVEVIGAVIFM